MNLHHKPIRYLAKAGYSSRGVVYLVIGVFALLAAIGSGENKSAKDALSTVLSQPFGTVMIVVLIAGLAGYVSWRLIQAIFDTDGHGRTLKGFTIRVGLLVSAGTYATLALYAGSRAGFFSGGSDSQGSTAEFIAASVGASWMALGLAAILFGIGAAHVWKAVRRKYADHFDADRQTMRFLDPIAFIGLIARGLVFFILSFLLVYRGLTAGEDGGTPDIGDAMYFVESLPFGTTLLIAMGAGIVLFALYSFSEAIWRRINLHASI